MGNNVERFWVLVLISLHVIIGGIQMKNERKNKRKMDERAESPGEVIWYRDKINYLLDKIEKEGDRKFLNQVLTILNKHIQKRGY